MARIIVVAECRHTQRGQVVHEEWLVPAHLESDHASAQLVERLGWAILDADEIEGAAETAAPSAIGSRSVSQARGGLRGEAA